MNGFDRAILEFVNQPALHPDALDRIMVRVAANSLVKGAFALAIVWAMWFSRPGQRDDGATPLNRDDAAGRIQRTILACFAGTFVALGLARSTSMLLPFRSRPLNHSEVFTVPPALELTSSNWFVNDSSIPSDHAALFYALATTIFLVSRRAGVFMFIYVTVMIMLPRVHLLLHYPTDIIAGAALGISCVLLAWKVGDATRVGRALVDRVYGWSLSHAPTFYAAMFIWSFCIAELFDSARRLANLGPLIKALSAH